MLKFINNIASNRIALSALISSALKSSVASTRLGYLWLIIDPLFMMLVYYFVVVVALNKGWEGFHLFALTGIICWGFFSRNVVITTGSLQKNFGLIRQVGLPPELCAISGSLVQLIFAAFGIFIIWLWAYPQIGLQSFGVIPILFLIMFYSFSFGLFFSVFSAYFPDISNFIAYGLRAAFFLSPVLYKPEVILDKESISTTIKFIYQLNPMVWLITAMRSVLLDGCWFDLDEFIMHTVIVMVLLQCCLMFFRKQTANAIKRL